MATQSMAAALAASLPAPVIPQAEAQPQVTKVPQRLEGVVDPEALRDVESVSLNSLVRVSRSTWLGLTSTNQCPSVSLAACAACANYTDPQVFLKIMKHSTDTLPAPPAPQYTDRAAPPTTALSAHVDSLGVLVGLDLDGVLEIEDSFPLPANTDSNIGGRFFPSRAVQQDPSRLTLRQIILC